MKIELDPKIQGKNLILSYTSGSFTVNHTTYTSGIVVTADQVSEWVMDRHTGPTQGHIETLLHLDPEIVIIGTGKRARFFPSEWAMLLMKKGIGVEIMDSGAACRCYNLLLQEGRRVVAGLLLPGQG